MSKATAYQWTEGQNADKVDRLCKVAEERMALSFGERMARDAETVWNHLLDLANNVSGTVPPHVQVDAANSILDRGPAPRKTKTESKTEITGLSEDKRKENFARVIALVKNVEKAEG